MGARITSGVGNLHVSNRPPARWPLTTVQFLLGQLADSRPSIVTLALRPLPSVTDIRHTNVKTSFCDRHTSYSFELLGFDPSSLCA
jgi:hypothetical protein